VEPLKAERDRHVIEAGLATAEDQWQRLATESPIDEAQATRFEAAVRAARDAVSRLAQEEAARSEQEKQASREQAQRAAACAAIEELAAGIARRVDSGEEPEPAWLDETAAQIAGMREQWTSLATPAVTAADLERFERRFERGIGTAERELERARTARANRARLSELMTEAEALAAAPSADGRKRWNALTQEWNDLGGQRTAGQSVGERFEAARATAARQEAEAREAERQRQQEELQRAVRFCEQIEAVAKAETLTLKDGDRALRDVKTALEGLGGL
jgi:hypothetical protein